MNYNKAKWILLFVLLVPQIAYGLQIEKRNPAKESDIWLQLESLNKVEELLVEGKRDEARIILEGFLEEYPDNSQAKDLYLRLREEDGLKAEGGNQSRLKGDRANEYWIKFQEYKKRGELAEARKMILKIEELYRGDGLRPAFLAGLDDEYSQIEKETKFIVSGDLAGIESRMKRALKANDSEKSLKMLIELYDELEKMLSKYEGIKSALVLREKILAEVNKSARILFAKAKMLKELEGCQFAIGKYRSLLEMLSFSELDFYKKTKLEIDNCES